MPWWDRRSPNTQPAEEHIFDDGGSGLLDACRTRFEGLGWSVRCDSRHSVWVKSPDAPLSVGLAPWMIDHLSIDEVLDEAEDKIRRAAASQN